MNLKNETMNNLVVKITELAVKITELEKQNELLKCCGNCKHYRFEFCHYFDNQMISANGFDDKCIHWEIYNNKK